MTRKKIIIFIVSFIVVGGIILGYYYSRTATNPTTPTTDETGYQPFNPFGTSPQNQGTTTDTTVSSTQEEQGAENNNSYETETPAGPSRFHKIADFAVAGAAFFEDERLIPEEQTPLTETTTPQTKQVKKPAPKFEIVPSIRYVEKVTGHIYQMYLDTKVEGKISNSTIPGIYEALFDSKAKSIIYRYLASDNRTITSYMATLGEKDGEFLPENITDIALSSDKTKFFYLTKGSTNILGTTRTFGETKKTQVFNSSFTEWLPQWVTSQKIYLTTKPSALVDGNVYSMNTSTGTLTKIFGGVKGLTTLANSDGSLILYSTSTNQGPRLGIFDVKKHTSLDIDVYTLPEKCIWAKDNVNIYCAAPNTISGASYPDAWYQGITSFTDRFIRINRETVQVNMIANSNNDVPVDGTQLFLTKDESQLFFINKKDSTLWGLDLR